MTLILQIACVLTVGIGTSIGQIPEYPVYGKWQNASKPPISFHLEQTWGDDENSDYFIRWVHSVAIDNGGNLYVLDSRNDHLQSLAPDGTFRWEIDQAGDGPGELNGPRGIAVDSYGTLYIGNISGRRIDRFDTKGDYIDSHKTEEFEANWLKVVGFLHDGKLVLTSNELGKYAAWVVVVDVSDSWTISDRYLIDQSYRDDLPEIANAPPSFSVFHDAVVNGNVTRYSMEKRSSGGEIIHRFGRQINQAVGPGYYNKGRSHYQFMYFQTTGPYALDNGYSIVEGYWPEKKINPDETLKNSVDLKGKAKPVPMLSSIDLFDSQNKLLYSLESENKTHKPFQRILGADNKGRIYALMNGEEPVIGRFRVQIEPPK